MTDRVLSQDEIDDVFRNLRAAPDEDDPAKRALPYDFRRPDRIAKDQLRAIHLLHENFARSLAASLSAYLRAYVAVNLVSVEQLSFMEFLQCLPAHLFGFAGDEPLRRKCRTGDEPRPGLPHFRDAA